MAVLNDTQINGTLTVTGTEEGNGHAGISGALGVGKFAFIDDGPFAVGLIDSGVSGAVTSSNYNFIINSNGTVQSHTLETDSSIKLHAGMSNEFNVCMNADQNPGELYVNHRGGFTGLRIQNGNGGLGSVTAGQFNASSDKRLKENIVPHTCANKDKTILDLPVYRFDFINGCKNQIGCLAQDLQEICPEIVTEGTDGYLSIQESKIVYLLLEEVKKLKHEVELLKMSTLDSCN